MIANQRSNARILACQHLLQLFLLLLGIILRIRVQATQHGIDTCAHHLVSVQRVHIHHIQVLIQHIKYLKVLCHLQLMVLYLLCLQRDKARQQHYNRQKS